MTGRLPRDAARRGAAFRPRTAARTTVLAAALTVVAALGTSSCAGPRTFREHPDRIAAVTTRSRLPARFVSGLIVVRSEIDGTGPWSLVLDTGASVMTLAPRVAAGASLDRGGWSEGRTPTIRGAHGSVVHADEAVSVREVRAGPLALSGVDAVLLDLSPLEAATGIVIDGVLPAQALAGHLLRLDLAHSEAYLDSGALPPADGREVLDLSGDSLPHLTLDVCGRTVEVLIDTGSTSGLSVPAAALPALRFRSAPVATGRLSTIAGSTAATAGRLADDVVIGGHRLEKPIVGIAPGAEGACGTALLGEFVVTLDLSHRRVRLERAEDAPVRSAPIRSPGFSFSRGANGWTVSDVRDGSAAHRGGLRPGDRIESVLGLPVAEISPTILAVLLATGGDLPLRVAGPGPARDVIATVETLVE